jgi:hypothetical protein
MVPNIRVAAVAALAAACFAGAQPARAQDLSFAAAAEAAGDEVYVVFGEPTLLFGPAMGLRPLVRAGAYYVIAPGENSMGVTPAAGLRYMTTGGFIQGAVGWNFAGNENGFDPIGGGANGLHTSVQTEFWGDGDWGASGIASYNWGSDFLWSRARLTKRIMPRANGGAVGLGAELVWQAVTDDGDAFDDNEYEATYIGPVLVFSHPTGPGFSIGGGVKMTQPDDDSTWYAKVELFVP